METRANYILLGGVAILGATLILLFAVWLAGAGWRQQWYTYDVVFAGPVRGLAEGGEVRFNGIKVGEIRRLSINRDDPNEVIARVRVNAAAPVRADSTAQLEAIGLTGVNLIQLSAGSPDAPLIRQRMGQSPPRIRATPGIIEGLLTEENSQLLVQTIRNLERISAALAEQDSVVTRSAEAAEALAEASRAITRLSDQSRQSLTTLSAQSSQVLTRTESAIGEAERALQDTQRAVRAFGQASTVAGDYALPEVAVTAQELRSLSDSLEVLAREIEREPTGFVQRRPPTVEVAP